MVSTSYCPLQLHTAADAADAADDDVADADAAAVAVLPLWLQAVERVTVCLAAPSPGVAVAAANASAKTEGEQTTPLLAWKRSDVHRGEQGSTRQEHSEVSLKPKRALEDPKCTLTSSERQPK